MKRFVVFINLLLISYVSAAQEKRNSENYYERINFNQLSTSPLRISSFINIHSASRTVADKNLPAGFIFSAKKMELKKITPFLSFSCGWNELNDEADNSVIAVRFSAAALNGTIG